MKKILKLHAQKKYNSFVNLIKKDVSIGEIFISPIPKLFRRIQRIISWLMEVIRPSIMVGLFADLSIGRFAGNYVTCGPVRSTRVNG